MRKGFPQRVLHDSEYLKCEYTKNIYFENSITRSHFLKRYFSNVQHWVSLDLGCFCFKISSLFFMIQDRISFTWLPVDRTRTYEPYFMLYVILRRYTVRENPPKAIQYYLFLLVIFPHSWLFWFRYWILRRKKSIKTFGKSLDGPSVNL